MKGKWRRLIFFFFLWSELILVQFHFIFIFLFDPSQSELIWSGLAVRGDPVQLLYLPSIKYSNFAQRHWNNKYIRTPLKFPWKSYPIPDQNGQSVYPSPDQNGAKILPDGAAHIYIAHIREYFPAPPPPPPGYGITYCLKFRVCRIKKHRCNVVIQHK